MSEENIKLLTGLKLVINQILAMFLKKILSSFRTLFLLIFHLLLPVIFIILYMVLYGEMAKSKDLPKLAISLDNYDDPITLIKEKVMNNYSRIYREVIGGHRIEKVDDITKRMLYLVSNFHVK